MKTYIQPTIQIVPFRHSGFICTSGQVRGVNTNMIDGTNITYGGGSNQAARVKSNTVDWDDWD